MAKWLAFLLILTSFAASGSHRTLKSLTGGPGQPNHLDFGDPSAPDLSQENKISVYTTGGFALIWKGANVEEKFLSGQPPQVERLKIAHADGTLLNDETGEDLWDPTIEVSLENPRERILYGAVMSATDDRKHALWPQDNWNRRTFAFRLKGGKWIREKDPLLGNIPEHETWVGHNYGHHFIKDESGQTFVFYERVTEERNGHPWKTELFAMKMKNSFATFGPEISILKIPHQVWPLARRSFGGSLVEGPRPFFANGKYFVSFSAGEYASDNYGIHLLQSDKIQGPYKPFLNESGKDLKDFGVDIENKRKLTWGAARAAFFQMRGEWWTVFHGIDQKDNSPVEDGLRNIFLAPVVIQRETIFLLP